MKKPKKQRTAYVLFRKDTPYKPKIVKCRKKYSRKIKHKNTQ